MTVIDRTNKWIVFGRVGAVVAAVCWSLSASAEPAPSYKLVDLGMVGPAGQPLNITNNGIVAGAFEGHGGTDQAVIYLDHRMIDLSKPGLGGGNSMAVGNIDWGEVVGGANTPGVDPHGEDFCAFQASGIPTAKGSCLPFHWRGGKMVALPTLDGGRGNNGVANSINNFAALAGAAENTTREPSCPAYDPAKLQFQKYQFKPVVWRHHVIEELATVGGDPVGWVKVINNQGQTVGATGTCAAFNFFLGFFMQPLHAVLWEKDGTPVDLGSLGGNEHSLWGNVAEGLNNAGHVVGSSSLADNLTFHAFFSTGKKGSLRDLGTVHGFADSWAIALNDSDEIVGASVNSTFTSTAATLWKHGVAADLNTLIPANSPIYLLAACSINSSGHIIGLAIDGKGNLHGYELTPVDE